MSPAPPALGSRPRSFPRVSGDEPLEGTVQQAAETVFPA